MSETGNKKTSAAQLSPRDRELLQEYERRCQLLEDRTISVAGRYQNGVYVVGRHGTGKTKIIRETLDKQNLPHVYRNGRMTPMGLFEQLALHPEHTMVIDDIPSLASERMAQQILLAALGGEPGDPRPITYSTKRKEERGKSFNFCGGVIAISNVPLGRDPLTDALTSRCVLLEHEPTDEELAAVMRCAALQGFKDMSPTECIQVVEFVIAESKSNDYRFDLRLMKKAFQDYRQHKHGKTSRSWQDLIRSSMHQILGTEAPVLLTKKLELELDRERVREVIRLYPEDTRRQIEQSGLKKSKFYELRRELNTSA